MIKDYLESQHIRTGEEAFTEAQASDEPVEELGDEELSDADRNYLQMYLDELEMLPEYTDGEKQAYIIQAMAGEKDSFGKLTEIYLKDVVQIAKIYNNQGVLMEDLIGEGNVALAASVTMLGSQEKPEDCEGMIIKYIMDAMEELVKETADAAETGDKALARVNDIYSKADKLSREYGRKVTVEELCEETHVSRKSVIDAIRISGFKIDCIELPTELRGEG